MKIRILLTTLVATVVSSAALQAQSWQYWQGGSGAWDYTSQQWGNSAPNGTINAFSSGDYAVFQGAPGAVTIDPAGVSAGWVKFTDNGFTVTGGTLTLVGNTSLDVQSGITAVIDSYVLNNTGNTTVGYGPTGSVLELGGGGDFGSGGYEQQRAGTLWLTAGTYTTSGGFNAYNYAGAPALGDPTLEFTIGSGVANGGASLNIGGQLGGTNYGGSGINSMNLDLVSLGSTTGDIVLMSYGSLVGTAFNSVTLNGAALPTGYSIDYAYGGSPEIALVVPEPSTWAMLLGGLGMLTMFRRRRA